MAALITSLGEEQILQLVKANCSWSAQLYTSNTTPTAADTLSTYTLATFIGSAASVISWGTVSLSSGKAQTSNPSITWTLLSGTGQTCYGYVVFDGSNNLIAASKFASTQSVVNPGDSISVTITLNLFDQSLC